jgi:hypothetical protein
MRIEGQGVSEMKVGIQKWTADKKLGTKQTKFRSHFVMVTYDRFPQNYVKNSAPFL